MNVAVESFAFHFPPRFAICFGLKKDKRIPKDCVEKVEWFDPRTNIKVAYDERLFLANRIQKRVLVPARTPWYRLSGSLSHGVGWTFHSEFLAQDQYRESCLLSIERSANAKNFIADKRREKREEKKEKAVEKAKAKGEKEHGQKGDSEGGGDSPGALAALGAAGSSVGGSSMFGGPAMSSGRNIFGGGSTSGTTSSFGGLFQNTANNSQQSSSSLFGGFGASAGSRSSIFGGGGSSSSVFGRSGFGGGAPGASSSSGLFQNPNTTGQSQQSSLFGAPPGTGSAANKWPIFGGTAAGCADPPASAKRPKPGEDEESDGSDDEEKEVADRRPVLIPVAGTMVGLVIPYIADRLHDELKRAGDLVKQIPPAWKPYYHYRTVMETFQKESEIECAICMEDFELSSVCVTPCAHIFCRDCLTEAVRSRGECPLCRGLVKQKDCVPLVGQIEIFENRKKKKAPDVGTGLGGGAACSSSAIPGSAKQRVVAKADEEQEAEEDVFTDEEDVLEHFTFGKEKPDEHERLMLDDAMRKLKQKMELAQTQAEEKERERERAKDRYLQYGTKIGGCIHLIKKVRKTERSTSGGRLGFILMLIKISHLVVRSVLPKIDFSSFSFIHSPEDPERRTWSLRLGLLSERSPQTQDRRRFSEREFPVCRGFRHGCCASSHNHAVPRSALPHLCSVAFDGNWGGRRKSRTFVGESEGEKHGGRRYSNLWRVFARTYDGPAAAT